MRLPSPARTAPAPAPPPRPAATAAPAPRTRAQALSEESVSLHPIPMPAAALANQVRDNGTVPYRRRRGRASDRGEAARREGDAAHFASGGSDMTALTYAGIGARATPSAVLADMTVMPVGWWLARTGWHLASGGADGRTARTVRCRRARRPANGRSGCPGPATTATMGRTASRSPGPSSRACMDIAANLHPAWNRCSRTVRKLHAQATSRSCSAKPAIGRSMPCVLDGPGRR